MPNLTIRSVLNVVRTFLDEIKKTNFFFDVVSVDLIEGEWEVECEVANHNEHEGFAYVIRVDDVSGEVTYVARTEEDAGEEEEDDDPDGTEGDGLGYSGM